MAEEAAAAPAPAPAPAAAEMDPMDALKAVMHSALIHNGLKRGLREATKALDRKAARLCCLAKDCDEPTYVKLVKALCDQKGIQMIEVPSGKQLGEWAGLCKIDEEGQPRKVVSCSCAAITDYGEDTPELQYLLNYLKSN